MLCQVCAFSSMCRKKMPSGHGSPRSGDWHHVKSSPVTRSISSLRIDLRFNPGLWRRSTPRRRRRSGRIRSSFPNEGPCSRSSDGRRQIGFFFHRGTTRLNDGLGHLPTIGLALHNPQHEPEAERPNSRANRQTAAGATLKRRCTASSDSSSCLPNLRTRMSAPLDTNCLSQVGWGGRGLRR